MTAVPCVRIKYLGILSAASFFATGLSIGTIPFSPYSRIYNRSAEHPRNAAHFNPRKNDGRRCPKSISESIGFDVRMPFAIVSKVAYTRPSGPTNGFGVNGRDLSDASRAMESARRLGDVPFFAPALFLVSCGLLFFFTPSAYTGDTRESTTYAQRLKPMEVRMEYTERQREEAVEAIHQLKIDLDHIAATVIKAERGDLGEGFAAAEKAMLAGAMRMRTLL